MLRDFILGLIRAVLKQSFVYYH